MNRFLIPLVTLSIAWAACSRSPGPGKSEAPVTPPASEAKGDVQEGSPAPATAPDSGSSSEAEKAPAESEAAATVDRDALARCYTAVYCAQKKGEMSRILSIYKEFGFETPQAFTKAWIEAAKDTEWVTRMAYEVGKKCP